MGPSLRACPRAVPYPRRRGLLRETSARVAGPGAAGRQRRSPAVGRPARRASGSRARSPSSTGARACSTVFMTLRDAVADISVPVTCSRTLVRRPQPAARRGRQRRRARQAVATTPTAARSRSTPARSGWSASASCWPGSSGAASCSPPRACSPPSSSGRCRSCPAGSGWSPRPTRAAERDVLENARRRWPAVAFEVAYAAHAGPARGRRGDRGARPARRATPTSTSSWSPAAAARSRTCCRSPTRR